jgi:hypothetical protein
MKCDDYRAAIAAEPGAPGGDLSAHAEQCTECAAFGNSMQALDELILRALQVEVAELRMPALPPSDESLSVVNLRPRRFTTPVWLALAASVALVAVLGVRQLTSTIVYPSLAAEVLAHVDHEPKALAVTTNAVAPARLNAVVQPYARMDSSVGLITYARTCVIDGNTVPHLVLQGENGPVTLILMPDEMVDGAVQLEGESVRGVILPVGNGSIAIIGERDEPLERIEQRVIQSMQWSI